LYLLLLLLLLLLIINLLIYLFAVTSEVLFIGIKTLLCDLLIKGISFDVVDVDVLGNVLLGCWTLVGIAYSISFVVCFGRCWNCLHHKFCDLHWEIESGMTMLWSMRVHLHRSHDGIAYSISFVICTERLNREWQCYEVCVHLHRSRNWRNCLQHKFCDLHWRDWTGNDNVMKYAFIYIGRMMELPTA